MKSCPWLLFLLSIWQLPVFAKTCELSCDITESNPLFKKLNSSLKFPKNIKNLCICAKNGKIDLLKYSLGNNNYMYEHKNSLWVKSEIKPIVYDVEQVVIKRSFYQDGVDKGINHNILAQVESMFKEKIKFSRNLHKFDKIKFLVEHKAAGDLVLMAEIQHNKKHLTAMRFLSHGHPGFYDASGHALVEGFDRVPINYSRISSPFRKSRKHPILGYTRPHKGVDLVANSGTPIYATSSGQIVSLGALRGYGKAIIIKHKGNYETRYAHMHSYAKGLKVGDYVNRKQLIGYVGMTGLATAPHCHYEFRIGHVAYDPMKVKLPEGEKLKGKRLQRFQAKWRKNYRLLQG